MCKFAVNSVPTRICLEEVTYFFAWQVKMVVGLTGEICLNNGIIFIVFIPFMVLVLTGFLADLLILLGKIVLIQTKWRTTSKLCIIFVILNLYLSLHKANLIAKLVQDNPIYRIIILIFLITILIVVTLLLFWLRILLLD